MSTPADTERATPGDTPPEPGDPISRPRRLLERAAPYSPVALAVAFNLFVLRGEVSPAAAPNDMGAHISMVRYIEQLWSHHKLPLDGWYPRLQLGVALFHHYQSLGPLIAGLFAVVFGAARTVAWSNYLLLSLWPICMYWTARLFGFSRWTAGSTALVAPLVSSVTGYGYEHGSFLWIGNGVWAQLWAMWLLPLTLAFTWRAIARGKGYALAALFLGLTITAHFLTAYLAILALGIWVLIAPKELLQRAGRAVIVGIGAALVGSWVLVPLLEDGKFSARSVYDKGTIFSNSYGFNRVMSWLFEGELFDHGRWPVLSILVAIGALVCLWRFTRDERARGVLGFTALSLVLFSGRSTFGFVLNRIPGGKDLLLHRFIMGVHLGGIVLAGVGAGLLVQLAFKFLDFRMPRTPPAAIVAALLLIGVVVLVPAWRERAHYDGTDATEINLQKTVDATDGRAFTTLADRAAAFGDGRIYAESAAPGGQNIMIGQVPTYIYLMDDDVDAVGFNLRTVSISDDVEVAFNPADLAQYNLFNIRYVILPTTMRPSVPATVLGSAGRWTLWGVSTSGYLQVVDTVSTITANRTNLGQQTAAFMQSALPAEGAIPTVAFGGGKAAAPTAPEGKPAGSPGSVSVQYALPDAGAFGGIVTTNRTSVVMLKTTYDPGWTVTVDGKPAKTQMLAPSFVGVEVPPGTHRIAFQYKNYPHYWLLLALGVLALVGLAVVPRYRTRRRGKAAPATP